MIKAKNGLEKLLWLLLTISPALDLVNGVWTYLLCGGNGGMLSSLDIKDLPTFSPSLLVRVSFLFAMVAYLFVRKQWKAIAVFGAIGCTWVLTVGYEALRGVPFSLMEDIQYIVRFCYCLVVVTAYGALFRQAGQDGAALRRRIDRVMGISLAILGLGVLVPYVFEMGFYTYADPLGYRGSRGFFYAGNDITVVMLLLLPVSLTAWMEAERPKADRWAMLQAAASAMCVISMLLVGTKTSFVALAGILLVTAGYGLFVALQEKNKLPLRRLGFVLALALILMLLLTILCPHSPLQTIWRSLSATGDYLEDASVETVVFSGRTGKLREAIAQLKAALPWSALVGIGRGSQQTIIEMDLAEVALYYGGLGCLSMLWLYLWQGVQVIRDLFRAFSLRNLTVSVALGLCVGYLTMAGHTLFSVTAGYYFAFLIVYARLFCSKEGLNTKIL